MAADHPPLNQQTNMQNNPYQILDNLIEGCQIISFDWRYVYINEAAARHGQRAQSELVGYTMMECYPGIERTEMFSLLDQCMRERTIGFMENEFVYPNGMTAWFELRIQPVNEGIIILSVDVTQRKQTEIELKRYTERMETLHEIDLTLIRGGSIKELVEAALKQVKHIISCQRASVVFIDHETNEGVIFTVDLQGDTALSAGVRSPVLPITFEGLDERNSRIISDFRLLQTLTPAIETMIQEGLVSGLQVLMVDNEQAIGSFALLANTPDFFTPEHRDIAIEVASQLTIALRQMELSSKLAQRTVTVEGMREFLQSTLDAFPSNTAVLAPDGSIISVNLPWRQFADSNGAQSANHFVGSNYLEICDGASGLSADEAAAAASGIRDVISGQNDEFALEYPCNSPDQERWFMLRVTPLAEPAPRRVVVAHINITQRKMVERAEREQRMLAEAMRDSLASLTTSSDVDSVMRQILAYSETVIPSDAGTIVLFDGDVGRVACLRGFGDEAEAYFADHTIPLNKGKFLRNFGADSHYLVADTETEPDWISFPFTDWVRSSVGVPILLYGRSIGLLMVDSASPNRFREKDVDNLRTFARYAALALENAHRLDDLEQMVSERTAELQAANERLEEQQRQLRYHANLQENVSDAVIVTDMDFHIQSWNRAAERIYGWLSSEVIGKHVSSILQTTFLSSDDLEHSIQRLREQGWWQGEVAQNHKDGSIRYILGSVTLVKDENGAPFSVISVNRDISERKLVEEALRNSAAEIHDLYNNAPCGYHSINSDGVIVQINDTELKWLDYDRDEVVNKLKITDIFSPASVLVFQKAFPLFKARGWVNDLEFEIVAKDGSIRHILLNATAIYDAGGQYLQSRSTLFDITAHKQTRLDLVASEARYRLLAENISDVIAKLDSNGIRTFITPSCFALLGYTPEELIGKPGIEIVHPDDRAASIAAVMEAIASAKTSFTMTQRMMHKAGHPVWVEVTSNIVRNPESSQAVEMIGVIRDVTERKRSENALSKQMEEELEFQTYLKSLHEVTIELTHINDIEKFYRSAVELGRERLGFERLALFLYEAESGMAIGTFGTDTQGHTSDEHDLRFVPDPNGIMVNAFEKAERFYFREDASLFHEMQPVGKGWNAATVLWNGTHSVGWLVTDNLLHRTPASKPLLEIFGLYALALGTLMGQKQSQLALRESEARYRMLAENINDLIMRSTLTSECLYISPSVETILGYTSEELLGRQTFDLINPDDKAIISEAYASALERNERISPHQYRARHKQGHYIWLETIGKPIYSETTHEILGVITSSRDVTERKHAEEALRESEEKFRLLLNAAPIATVISDQAGKITLVNVRAEEVFGYDRTEMIGQPVEMLVPQYARSIHSHNRTVYMSAPRVRRMGEGLELFARRKDASEVPVEIELSFIQSKSGIMVMSFIVDITERKRIANELERQRMFLQNIIDISPSMIFVKDYESRFVLANPTVARMYNTTVDGIIGKSETDISRRPNEAYNYLKADKQVIESGETLHFEESLTTPTGEVRWLQTTKLPIVGTDGRSRYVLGVATDITEHRRAEDALRAAIEKEKELGELKTRFVSMASHEFRTPLATILALTETLTIYRHKLTEAQIDERFAKIKDQIGHLKDIMEDVLLLARMQARRVEFDPVRLDLDDLCRSVLDSFLNQANFKHRINYSCSDGSHDVKLDRKLMRQMISNLVSNAVKYSDEDKPINVSLEFLPTEVAFTITDEGIGIPEPDQKHLFEPFHRAANVGTISGTGLGLVITKESVELHGGSISVHSMLNIGTTFTIRIPVSET